MLSHVLSKVAGFLVVPSDVLVALGLLGLLLLRSRFQRTARGLLTMSLGLLVVAGLSPLGNALILPLEQRFPAWSGSAADGIVVLGGSIGPTLTAARGQPALDESAERLTEIADLARRFPNARILLAGGYSGVAKDVPGEARAAVPLLESFGIARERILLEDKSLNTHQNALFSKAVAQPKPGERWLLVTSAYHMPRAVGCFRRVGFPVEAYPVDWRTTGRLDQWFPFESIAKGLARTDTAVHEWVGLVVYRLIGRTDVLFPKPD